MMITGEVWSREWRNEEELELECIVANCSQKDSPLSDCLSHFSPTELALSVFFFLFDVFRFRFALLRN